MHALTTQNKLILDQFQFFESLQNSDAKGYVYLVRTYLNVAFIKHSQSFQQVVKQNYTQEMAQFSGIHFKEVVYRNNKCKKRNKLQERA